MNTWKANWNYPTQIRTGLGRVEELSEICREIGIEAPLLVTDSGLADLDITRRALEGLKTSGLRVGLFSDVQPNPTGADVTSGITSFLDGGYDGVIAFGGGSGLDAGKAVALAARQDANLWDFEDIGDNFKRADARRIPPIVAVPTTAGTGSEVGRCSVILDEDAELKRILFHPMMLPRVVLLDPELTVGLPPRLTAATGMDALSHNLEALCSPAFHPQAEGIAVEAIRRIGEHLPRAFADGTDMESREMMLVAAMMGATAFQRGLGGMHALAHPLGALYGAHHGALNAILMPYVLTANLSAIREPLSRLARYLNLERSDAIATIEWVLGLRKTLNIPNTLREIGIDARQAARVGAMAVADPTAATNPIRFSAEEYSVIFQRALDGDL